MSALPGGRRELQHSQIRGYQTKNKRLIYLELDSFEGVVRVEQSYLAGQAGGDFPLKDSCFEGQSYGAACYHLQAPSEMDFSFMEGERCLYSHPHHFASNIAFVDFYCPHAQALKAYVPWPKGVGGKEALYRGHMEDLLVQAVEQHKPGLKDFKREERGEGLGWPGQSVWTRGPQSPGKNPVGHLEYWGPLRSGGLGVFGHLMSMKEGLRSG